MEETRDRYVVLQRDPFARANLCREVVPMDHRQRCDWCGEKSRFVYAWVEDTVSPILALISAERNQFCSVGCWRAYNS